MKSISWSWRNAVFGALLVSAPCAVIATGHVKGGLAFLFGALPAALVGLLPTRRARTALVVIGTLFGLSMMVGSFVAQWWWLAVPTMFVFGFAGASLAAKKPLGLLALNLCVPLAGIGLSFGGLKDSVRVALTIVVGSVLAYAWSLVLPEFHVPPRPRAVLLSAADARDYGVRLGLAGATAAAVGFAFGVEHIGWIAGSALLVMRPTADMQRLRSLGRVLSVFVGALVASWLLGQGLGPVAIAVVTGGSLLLGAATRDSRWYITPAFSTFLVFWVLLYGDATKASITHRFDERVLETLGGVAIAYIFGLLIPTLRDRIANARCAMHPPAARSQRSRASSCAKAVAQPPSRSGCTLTETRS